ncbi:MAG: hypothetical protein PHN84_09040 [Desulfuromonadaceae bacterium]|nr:hypothetical protein [Desulfuromonadaceae bacterium]MDD2856910.1 hypothetical protein [Desulfuromonadaceae bacterium]
MLAEITAAISGARGALDLTKGIASLAAEYGIKERTIDLQTQILSLISQLIEIQTRVATLTQENVDIRRELENMLQWERDVVPRYELIELAKGVYAYKLRNIPVDLEHNGEPAHHVCYGCYQKRRKAVLQFSGYDCRGAKLTCNECGETIINHADKPPSVGPISVPRRDPFSGY